MPKAIVEREEEPLERAIRLMQVALVDLEVADLHIAPCALTHAIEITRIEAARYSKP